MAFRQTHILAPNLIFPHTLFQEQKQCEKTSDKIILTFFFFQKSKLNISLGSQSCTSRLFNSSLTLPVPFTGFPGCSQKDGYSYQLVPWKMIAVWAPCSAYQISPPCVSALAGAHPNTSQGSFGKGQLVLAPVPSSLHWEKTFQQTLYLNTGQKGVEQMLHQLFR